VKAAKIITAIIGVFITMPIWFYLVHWLLVASGAGDLQMFLFWIYLPIALFTGVLSSVLNVVKDGK
jgi:hypothetical protein